MKDFLRTLEIPLQDFDPIRDGIDILLVAFLNYKLLMLMRGTRAWRVVLGAMAFVVLLYASNAAGLSTLHWILDKATLLAPVALVILLLPELRQLLMLPTLHTWLDKLGISTVFGAAEVAAEAQTVEELVAAVAEMSSTRVGAILVLERAAPLDDIITNGVLLNARVSAPLIGSIFYEGNPLHDGAAVIRGDTIVAAACRLPLSESARVDQSAHMRHRAALGVAEAFDCLAIVVSEERGTISVAYDGHLRRLTGHGELREVLNQVIRGDQAPKNRRVRVRSRVEAKP